jgi:hypothetical protein
MDPMDAPPSVPQIEVGDVAILITGIAFGAFCVWLAVRVYNRRERWAKRTAIGAAVAALYVVGLGPACWISSRTGCGGAPLSAGYCPLTWVMLRGGRSEYVIDWYSHVASAAGWGWLRTGDAYAKWDEIPNHPYPAQPF